MKDPSFTLLEVRRSPTEPPAGDELQRIVTAWLAARLSTRPA